MIETNIKAISDFPSKGVVFRDILPLFQDAKAFGEMLDLLCAPWHSRGIDKVMGIEARGFIVGATVADRLRAGFVAARKKGKLPRERISRSYALEYSTAELEVHCDAIAPGETILLVDDILATGGTAGAGLALVKELGGAVAGCTFIVNLPDLGGEAALRDAGHDVHFLCKF